jgi:DNA-directed RNA polymerase alpha subunit
MRSEPVRAPHPERRNAIHTVKELGRGRKNDIADIKNLYKNHETFINNQKRE